MKLNISILSNKYFFTLILFFTTLVLFAQNKDFTNLKIQANKYFETGKYKQCYETYNKALIYAPSDVESKDGAAKCKKLFGQEQKRIEKEENKKHQKEADDLAEAKRKQKEIEDSVKAKREREQKEAADLAEAKRKQKEADDLAETKRKQKESDVLAETKRKQKEADDLAETKRKQKEADDLAETKRKQKEADDLAETRKKEYIEQKEKYQVFTSKVERGDKALNEKRFYSAESYYNDAIKLGKDCEFCQSKISYCQERLANCKEFQSFNSQMRTRKTKIIITSTLALGTGVYAYSLNNQWKNQIGALEKATIDPDNDGKIIGQATYNTYKTAYDAAKAVQKKHGLFIGCMSTAIVAGVYDAYLLLRKPTKPKSLSIRPATIGYGVALNLKF